MQICGRKMLYGTPNLLGRVGIFHKSFWPQITLNVQMCTKSHVSRPYLMGVGMKNENIFLGIS